MGSTTKSRIPVVDLSGENLKPGSSSWNSACQDIRRALEEYGGLEVVYCNPSIEFNKQIFDALHELFQLPLEIKMKNENPKPSHGYVGRLPSHPLHESLGIEDATNKDECQKFTDTLWPEGNKNFCETIHGYAKMVAELQELLVRMICESYGIDKQFTESHIKSTTYLVRLLSYTRSEGDTDIGLNGHTDKSFFSILYQNHVNGLEMRTKDGEWIPYEPSSHSSFAVLVGDACMAWSNDRLKSGYHRVMVRGEEVRYGLALFSFQKGVTKQPEELVDEEHPLLYKPFEHLGLLDFFKATDSQKNKDANLIKAYCGV